MTTGAYNRETSYASVSRMLGSGRGTGIPLWYLWRVTRTHDEPVWRTRNQATVLRLATSHVLTMDFRLTTTQWEEEFTNVDEFISIQSHC